MVYRVAFSVYVDGRREGGFGGDMSCEPDSVLVVPYVASCDWRSLPVDAVAQMVSVEPLVTFVSPWGLQSGRPASLRICDMVP